MTNIPIRRIDKLPYASPSGIPTSPTTVRVFVVVVRTSPPGSQTVSTDGNVYMVLEQSDGKPVIRIYGLFWFDYDAGTGTNAYLEIHAIYGDALILRVVTDTITLRGSRTYIDLNLRFVHDAGAYNDLLYTSLNHGADVHSIAAYDSTLVNHARTHGANCLTGNLSDMEIEEVTVTVGSSQFTVTAANTLGNLLMVPATDVRQFLLLSLYAANIPCGVLAYSSSVRW